MTMICLQEWTIYESNDNSFLSFLVQRRRLGLETAGRDGNEIMECVYRRPRAIGRRKK